MGRIRDIVFDCNHPASLARFWAAAIDGYEVAPYDDAELARLRSMGVEDPEDDPTVLVDAPGVTPRLFFQRVEEPRQVKNRVHIDLISEDQAAEVERLVGLGATVTRDDPTAGWVTLSDPEGNAFCILDDASVSGDGFGR